MKRIIALTTILALCTAALTACSTAPEASGTTATATTAASSASETSASSEDITEATSETTPEVIFTGHKVEVTDLSVTTLKDVSGTEYRTIIPKVIVDDKEAGNINQAISDTIQKEYPMTQDGDYVDGEETRYAWGFRGNILSVVIIGSEIGTDGHRYSIFNYDLDTLQAASNEDVVKSYGLTYEEFNKKVEDAYRAWWDSEIWLQGETEYLDKTIGAISSSVTPLVMPNGDIGAASLTYTPSQFSESVECFDLNTLTISYFPEE